jgi:IMP and pyridine-specific 5'-nucleotidase
LITFDADGTLYADGHHFEQDNEMIQLFMSLMKVGVLLFSAAWLHLCACR